MSERYGRFGFVFRKRAIYELGGRPCAYLDRDAFGVVSQFRTAADGSHARRLFGLSNVLCPPGAGKIQDYSHEREWRIFGDLAFASSPAEMLLAPTTHLAQVRGLFPMATTIPIDALFEWGA